MASAVSARAPKQRLLTEDETIQTFDSWKSIMIYNLKLDKSFKRFLAKGVKWTVVSEDTDDNRGFVDETHGNESDRLKADELAALLELFLEQIANYAPIINRYFIVEQSTCLEDVWQMIRAHYGFRASGSSFIDIAYVTYDPNEKHECLYQRIYSLVRDSLLKASGDITHHDKKVTRNEVMTPTVENFIVLTWLRLIHPELPSVVKERYGTDLRTKTLASLKSVISQGLHSLLSGIKSDDNPRTYRLEEDIHTLRIGQRRQQRRDNPRDYRNDSRDQRPINKKECPICAQVGRPRINHFLRECPFLPEQDRRYMGGRTRLVEIEVEDEDVSEEDLSPEVYSVHSHVREDAPPSIRRVSVKASPHLKVFSGANTAVLCLDSGAESSVIRESEAMRLGLRIQPNKSQRPSQAEGSGFLNIVGEVFTTFTWKRHALRFEALVSRDLASPIIAGVPFLEANGIDILFGTKELLMPGSTRIPFSTDKQRPGSNIRNINVELIRAQGGRQTIWPGDYIELELPMAMSGEDSVMLEPRQDTRSPNIPSAFRACESSVVAGHIRVLNVSDLPAVIAKDDHLFNVSAVTSAQPDALQAEAPIKASPPDDGLTNAALIKIDPQGSLLSQDQVSKFRAINERHSSVFSSHYPGYNGAMGRVEAVVNMGPTKPPQRKGRMPQYSRGRLNELQDKLDDMEYRGVIATPDKAGTVVENLNPAFLVNKPNGNGTRTVTAFTEVAKYCKPQPALLPDVDQVMRQIAQWTFVIITDLASAYFQIPLALQSRKYCGISTPFKGTRVYCRSAMGMPGSETALEELMSRVLGTLIQEGRVAKLADDLYIGANDVMGLLDNWERTLSALDTCDLRLSPAKTIICPKRARVLGWDWECGRISANPHTISVLSTCEPPPTNKALRSFIGSYKALSKVIPSSAVHLGPLDAVATKGASSDRIMWTQELLEHFRRTQEALRGCRTITLPTPDDELWLVTDAASRPTGIGATLYIKRDEEVRVGGYFSAKLKDNQRKWLPCELEALAIAGAIRHFAPYLLQTNRDKFCATDSKPCVDAVRKLERGEFSLSPRVSSLLSHVGRYGIAVIHIKGAQNIAADYASRHPVECQDRCCQVCRFVDQLVEEPVINAVQGIDHCPTYANRPAWKNLQATCGTLRRVYAHLVQGTRPSKKEKSIRDVKALLSVATVAPDGLLVVRASNLYSDVRDRVVVPRDILNGILTALHIKLNHPSTHQLKAVFNRSYFTLGLEKAAPAIADACNVCVSTQNLKRVEPEYASEPAAPELLRTFAADVMKRARQCVFVLRETITSFTMTALIPDETARSLKAGIAGTILPLHLQDGPPVVIRCDPGPGFQALSSDRELERMNISLDIGQAKNVNKNPVAERAIAELHACLRKSHPDGSHVTPLQLANATAIMNSRIRGVGLSSWESVFRRDMHTGQQLSFSDESIITSKVLERETNQQHAIASRGRHINPAMTVEPPRPGSLVYLHSDRDKTRARPRYVVVSASDGWVYISKFTDTQLRERQYKVRAKDCFPVPNQVEAVEPTDSGEDDPGSVAECDGPVSTDSVPDEVPDPGGTVTKLPPDIPQAILPDEPVSAPAPPGNSRSDAVAVEPSVPDSPDVVPDSPDEVPDSPDEVPDVGVTTRARGRRLKEKNLIPPDVPQRVVQVTRPKRTRQLPVWAKDYVLETVGNLAYVYSIIHARNSEGEEKRKREKPRQ